MLLWLLGTPQSLAGEEKNRAHHGPNLVLIVVDTLRAGRLGIYGYGEPTSPRIDALARQATLFERAFATAPWTTPSMASMLTGLYPRELGIGPRPVVVSGDFGTLAEAFRDAGYLTHGIVSHMLVGSQLGFDQGFESFDETQRHRALTAGSDLETALDRIDAALGQ